MTEAFLIFVFGFIFSAFGSIVGFGGGVFMVPILVGVFHVPIDIAVGSTIFALLPGSLISTFYNIKRKRIDFRAGIYLEIPTIVGTVIGSLLTTVFSQILMTVIFAVFVGSVGIFTIIKANRKSGFSREAGFFSRLNQIGPGIVRHTQNKEYRISLFSALIFGLMAGTMAGLLGIGGGFLKTPIMANVFGMPASMAAATTLFMIVFTSLTGSISHFFLGNINFTYGIPIIIGFISGAFAGNRLNMKFSEKILTQLIGIGLLLAGFFLMADVIFVK